MSKVPNNKVRSIRCETPKVVVELDQIGVFLAGGEALYALAKGTLTRLTITMKSIMRPC